MPRLPRLRSHALEAPTPSDIHHALEGLGVVDAEALCAEIARASGVPTLAECRDLDDLEAIADALAGQPGPVGLAGRAGLVRIRVYRELAQTSADLPSPAWDWARIALDHLVRSRVPRRSRLHEIVALDPFAPELRPELDQAAARMAQRAGSAFAAVNVLLDGAQCLVGQHGAPDWVTRAGGIPSEWSFCSTMIRTREPYVIPDTGADVLHRLNPTVLHDGLGSYVGAPLVTSRGEVIGSCCVAGPGADTLGPEALAAVEEEARVVVAELERRRRDPEDA